MSLTTGFQKQIWRGRPAIRIRTGRRARRNATRLVLEAIEDRLAPAVIIWDNGGGNNSASNAVNWVGNVLPTAGDTVRFDATTSANCIIDFPFAVQVAGVQVHAAYGGTITMPSQDLTIAGNFSQAGGTVNMSGATFVEVTGDVNVTGGVVRAPSAGVFTAGGDWKVAPAATFDHSGGSITFNKASGTLALDSGGADANHDFFNLFHAGTATMTLGDPLLVAGNLGNNQGAIDLAGNDATVMLSAVLADANVVNSGGAATLSSNSNFEVQNGTVSAVLAGPAPLYKTGPGTVTLAATNALTDVTVIQGGTLSISADANLGTPPSPFPTPNSVQLDGGTLLTTATFTLNSNRGIALGPVAGGSGTGTIDVGGGTTLTYNGVIANNGAGGTTGSLVKTGLGALVVGGANTYTGTTTIARGTLAAASVVVSAGQSSLGNAASPVVLGGAGSSGLLSYTGGTATYTRGLTVSAGGGGLEVAIPGQTLTIGTNGVTTAGTLGVGGPGDTTVSGVIGPGAGGLAKSGTGTLTLGASNTYGGATTVSGGLLRDGAADALPSATALTVTGTGAVDLAGFAQRVGSLSGDGAVTDSGGPATLTLADPGAHSFAGVIGGPLSLAVTGPGTVTLSGANTFGGATTVTNGTLQFGAGNVLPDTTDVSVGSGAALDVGAFSDAINSLHLLGGSVTGTGGVLTGLTDFDVQSGTVSAKLGGTVGLVKTTGGSVTLNGANTFTGPTTVSGGVLTIGADSALGTAPGAATPGHLILDGGYLETTATFTLATNRGVAIGPTSGTGPGRFDVVGTLTYGGTIADNGAGSGQLVKTGDGTLVLSGSNTYSDSTLVAAGHLQLGADNALPGPGGVLVNGASATLALTGHAQTLATVTLQDGSISGPGVLTSANPFDVRKGTISADLAGTGPSVGLNKIDETTVFLSGACTYAGSTTVHAGELRLTGAGSIAGDVAVNATGVLGGTGTVGGSVTAAAGA